MGNTFKNGKVNVVLVSGKAGSGKDTVANFIVNFILDNGIAEISEVEMHHFAGKLKQVVASLGWDGEKDISGRKLLQDVGNSLRDYDEFTWSSIVKNRVENQVFPPRFVVIPDWKYESEFVDFCGALYNAIKVRVVGREDGIGELSNDISENSLPDESSFYDFVVHNDGDLSYLRGVEVARLMSELLSDYE